VAENEAADAVAAEDETADASPAASTPPAVSAISERAAPRQPGRCPRIR
jgi:hypothetical protein